MTTIEIDFDVYKELTNRRKSEATTYNDVIRELLRLPVTSRNNPKAVASASEGWVSKGVLFPNGTEFRASYKGKTYTARVENNKFMMDGVAINSLSLAAHGITKKSVNGWQFWECKLPGDTRWRILTSLRNE